MYTGLLHLHSTMRYLVLIALLAAFTKSLIAFAQNGKFGKLENALSASALGLTHLQIVFGIIMLFVSPKAKLAFSDMGMAMKDGLLRFYSVEHGLMMIIAAVLITVGRSKAKKATDDVAKNKKIALFYGLGLAIIFSMIPWPFLRDFGTWI